MTLPKNSPEAKDIEYILHPYTNMVAHRESGPLIVSRGDGCRIYDSDGKDYIEALSGLWSASLGFSQPRLVDAAMRQMRELPYMHIFASRSHLPAIELSERLVTLFGRDMQKVLFSCSGSEANDSAIKICRYYHNAIGKPNKKKIISRWRGYHGVTLAAASLTGLPALHQDFDLPIDGILHSECPFYYRYHAEDESVDEFTDRMVASLASLIESEGADSIAAFIAEPVMGAGGVIIPPSGYFDKVQKLLRDSDILFIADEVICGFGRLGELFGCDVFDISPDMVTFAKALSASYQPISALLMSREISEVVCDNSGRLGSFGHGYTYAAHPVAVAVALETLKIYEEMDIAGVVSGKAQEFAEGLASLEESYNFVAASRCVGLIGAFDVVKDRRSRVYYDAKDGMAARLVWHAHAHGVLVRAVFGDGIAFCPPLIVSSEDMRDMFDRMHKACADFAKEL